MDLRQLLVSELARRQYDNARYSLRAYARDLGTDHATLSQVLRGRRVLSPRLARQFGRKLRLPEPAIAEACELHHAEALLRLAKLRAFRCDSRWIATRTGLPLDAVNRALHRLIFDRRLIMAARDRWIFPTIHHDQPNHPLADHLARAGQSRGVLSKTFRLESHGRQRPRLP
jgi:hypothetical protein